MKFFLAMLLMAAAESSVKGAVDDHAALRNRKLPKCVKKGGYCVPYPDNCCGGTECQDNICCIPELVNGCDLTEDCCPFASDGASSLVCIESICVAGAVPTEEPRPCGIHGEPCLVTGTDSSQNDCCGDMKYNCELVSEYDDTRCCMPLGAKGCSFDYHCCGESDGNYCLESRCVDEYGEYPDDSEGTRDCGLKGDVCEDVSECCGGETKYQCLDTGYEGTTCCLKSSINGCSEDAHCCDGHCEVALALCCIPNGGDCVHDLSYECCTGYCNNGKCDTL